MGFPELGWNVTAKSMLVSPTCTESTDEESFCQSKARAIRVGVVIIRDMAADAAALAILFGW